MKHHGRPVEDLTGQRFGSLTVLHREPNQNGRTCWLCQCDCGNTCTVLSRDLKRGSATSCGCKKKTGNNRLDLTGRKFGRLLVLCPTENRSKRGSVCWKCRCDCGNKVEVSSDFLVEGICQSCGCLKLENQAKIKGRLRMVNGTCVEFLEKRKHRSDNKSGFRGVFLTDRNTYRVSITLQGKRYNLGTFSNFDDAVAARMEAEEKLYGKFLESYKEWEEHADQDPEWARTHPFEYQAG